MARIAMTISANKAVASPRGYTLFEILLALGIVAILLGVTVPMIISSYGETATEEIARQLQSAATSAQTAAIQTGEARRLRVTERGLLSSGSSTSLAELPKGWKLQIQRMTESKFRKPEKLEYWEFNSVGICEPVSFRIMKGTESLVVKFDPLTALIVTDND
jgi:prepilin-type N-terminal cleavage/methylation domain-containing protein